MTVFSKDSKYRDLLISAVLVGLALLIRAPGLGKWCVTSDEYFLSQSVSFIQQSGIPKFPSGGYYTRGILYQYMMAIPVEYFQNREFALRLLPLLFGVLTISMVYIFCRSMLPVLPSFLCSLLLLFSSWHIEFSRFARFYTAFQFIFFVFLYSLYSKKSPYILWAIAFLAIFIYEGSIFLPFLLLTLFILDDKYNIPGKLYKIIFLSISLVSINYIVNGMNWRDFHVENALPVAMASTAHVSTAYASFMNKLPFIVPSLELHTFVFRSKATVLLYILVLFYTGYVLSVLYGRIKKDDAKWIYFYFLVILLLQLLHQYLLLGFILVILWINNPKTKTLYYDSIRLLFSHFILTTIFWISMILLSHNGNKILYYLVGYPSIKSLIILPYLSSVPLWGIVAFSVILISVVHSIISKPGDPNRFVLTVLLLCVFLLSILKVPEKSTRYSFFFYPLIFILGYIELNSLIYWFKNKKIGYNYKYLYTILLCVPVFLFISTEDYNRLHILDVSKKEINFRMGKYKKYQEHWYERFDYETPAIYINNSYQSGDIVIIDSNPFANYLKVPLYFFSPTNTYWFRQFSRKLGTEEIWSGSPMISSVPSIIKLIPKNIENYLWLIAQDQISGGYRIVDIAREYDLNVSNEYSGIDKRFKVWKISRKYQ